MTDIIAAEGGVRVPGVEDSQKEFNLAFIVTRDTPYTDADYAYFSLLSYELMSRQAPQPNRSFGPFYWATGGRATLNTRLPVDVVEPQGLPGVGLPKPTAMPTHVGGDSPEVTPTPPVSAAAVGTPLPAIPFTVESDARTSSGAARCAILPTLVLGTGTVAGATRRRRHD
jgi:hypothetical protein